MSLKEKLDEVRTQFEKTAPAEALTIMHRATDDLSKSDIMGQVLKKGDPVPKFSALDLNGEETASTTLFEKGPLVLSFYRGTW